MSSANIVHVAALQVFDSRGNPTVEVEIGLEDGSFGRAIVPSGASTGEHEAHELRDGDPKKYGGKGVSKAVANVNGEIFDAVKGIDARDQKSVDEVMIALDGTKNKSRLGANALLGVSMATAHAAADFEQVPLFAHFADLADAPDPVVLPTPMMNVINGGSHADSGLEIQEFMILPTGAKNFSEGLQMGTEVFHALKKILHKRKMVVAVGDEGGFAPHLPSNEAALEILLEAIETAGHTGKIELGMDAAASEFFRDGKYFLEGEKNSAEVTTFFQNLCEKYPIISIEDAFDENDWKGFSQMNALLGKKIQLVGDDLLVTNPHFLSRGITEKSANSILIKMNQIGSITETIKTVKMAQEAGWTTVISHRSGESEDTTIADLAVGLGAGQIKTGSLCRSERIAKYNQLLRIEDLLDTDAKYFGKIR